MGNIRGGDKGVSFEDFTINRTKTKQTALVEEDDEIEISGTINLEKEK